MPEQPKFALTEDEVIHELWPKYYDGDGRSTLSTDTDVAIAASEFTLRKVVTEVILPIKVGQDAFHAYFKIPVNMFVRLCEEAGIDA